MARRARKGFLEPLGDVIAHDRELRVPKAFGGAPVSPRDWEAAVGSRIAARAEPVLLERGVLLVRVATSTWAQELALLGDAIVEQLHGRGLGVHQLRFRVGTVAPKARQGSREPPRHEPPVAPLPVALQEELARVADPELRAAIARAAGKNLGWQLMNARSRARPAAATGTRATVPGPRGAEAESAPSDRTRPPARGARSDKP